MLIWCHSPMHLGNSPFLACQTRRVLYRCAKSMPCWPVLELLETGQSLPVDPADLATTPPANGASAENSMMLLSISLLASALLLLNALSSTMCFSSCNDRRIPRAATALTAAAPGAALRGGAPSNALQIDTGIRQQACAQTAGLPSSWTSLMPSNRWARHVQGLSPAPCQPHSRPPI